MTAVRPALVPSVWMLCQTSLVVSAARVPLSGTPEVRRGRGLGEGGGALVRGGVQFGSVAERCSLKRR